MLAGCGERVPAADAAVFHYAVGHEVQDLDPHVVTGAPERAVLAALFEGLVAEREDGRGTEGGVAENWASSPDGLRWVFHLRRSARWSNGAPVTAHDFVASYRRILSPGLGAEFAYNLFPLAGAEDFHAGRLRDFSEVGVKALDDHTLQLTLRHRTPFLLDMLKHYTWFPVHLPTLEQHGGVLRRGSAWTRPESFVGNGPFVLTSWRPQDRIVVTRSPTYWDRARVTLESVHFHPTENIETQERMFRTGALHRTAELPLSKVPVYRREHPAVYRQDPYYGVYMYRLNVSRAPLTDVRVRRALSLAIDREAIVSRVTQGGQQPAYQYCPPAEKYRSRARLMGDPAAARQLLAEAGFAGGRGFPRLELLYNTSESHRAIAEAIQQMWRRELGIGVELVNREWKVYLDAMHQRSYDIARGGWIANYADPHTFFDVFLGGGGNNMTGYANVEYDRLVSAALRSGSEEERGEIYQQLDALLMRDVPVIPIYFYTRTYALAANVTGWPANALDSRSWKYVGLRGPGGRSPDR